MPGSQTSRRMTSKSLGGGPFEGLFGAGRGRDEIAFIGEDGGKRFANAAFVVNDQNAGLRSDHEDSAPECSPARAGVASAAGSSTRKREPTGELSSTCKVPPCSATMRAAMARPSPVPRSLVEKCGRKSLSLSSGEMP